MKKIYDIETLLGCFTYTDIDVDTLEVRQFVIHPLRNDLREFVDYLLNSDITVQIGFNNLAFDYPVLHFIITNSDRWFNSKIIYTPQDILTEIHTEAQRVIASHNDISKRVWIKDYYIPQIDLFKVWHYDNRAKSTSLKALEVSLNLDNVMEMPIPHTKDDITLQEVNGILDYNKIDVIATHQFYLRSREKLNLRMKLRNLYNIECINWNNGKIGEELLLKLYCERIKADTWVVRKTRTHREKIHLKQCVPDKIRFDTVLFNDVVDKFKAKIIKPDEAKESASKAKGKNKVASIVFKQCAIDYGLGGVHGCTHKGVYESDNRFIIKSLDVASLYPNMALVLRFFPEHLGPILLDVYEKEIVGVRMKEKAKPKHLQDKTIIDALKEAANIPYGKSNDKFSFLYDPLYTMKTTVGGQLFLSMLAERLGTIPGIHILMFNTDGMEVMIERKYESMYNSICTRWEHETGLVLEFNDYTKMVIADVNNYIAVDINGKVKNKGRFEVDKKIGDEPAYYKDNSFRIVPLALERFFASNVPVEHTIYNHLKSSNYGNSKNYGIFDFCGRQKFGSDSFGETQEYIGHDVVTRKHSKIIRYYISSTGAKLVKRFYKGKTTNIHGGYHITEFNVKVDKEDYNINYDFYIQEAYKEINQIVSKQQTLFK